MVFSGGKSGIGSHDGGSPHALKTPGKRAQGNEGNGPVLAERGVAPATEPISLPVLTAAIGRAAEAGLDAFPRTAESTPGAVPQLLLRVHYAILQYERLMAPAVDDGAESDVADDS